MVFLRLELDITADEELAADRIAGCGDFRIPALGELAGCEQIIA